MHLSDFFFFFFFFFFFLLPHSKFKEMVDYIMLFFFSSVSGGSLCIALSFVLMCDVCAG